ncbi:hypothetical protein MMAN_09710 [Mycobacterium mantenii]|uniref:Serine protease n=1 Tax=Mycobacterium mantenii TaxID=560555 RepID=A0A1X0G136_MYCNT|nr:serine protease [Mycobacterium mantenii]MCV7244745.1 trypsin-like peptidase domain-containing protein [Mycobacterium mantenii]ORB07508.1 hypothetical protein BST30_06035 [Mycobacterium mantenii]BBY36837.1 hypothetical protein MMAN_09710 [Mycobacterium mantenii]
MKATLAGAGIITSMTSTPQLDMIPTSVISRVLQFTGERERPGTAFVIGTGADQRLITARHLCNDEHEEVVYLRHPWTNKGFAYQTTLIRVGRDVASKADFAVFRMQNPIHVGDDIPLVTGGMFIPQTAFVIGYPHGWGTQGKGDLQTLPLVKSCVIAGRATIEDIDLFYVDTIVNRGFSGGPLMFIDKRTGEAKFAGVVVKNMTTPIREPTSNEPNPPEAPAGIGVVIAELTFRAALQTGTG